MILHKFKPTSPGSRHRKEICILKPFLKFKKWQEINKKRFIGRTSNSKILLNKRSAPTLKKHINVFKKTFLLAKPALILQFNYFFKHRALTALCKFTNGAYSNMRIVHGNMPGDFIKTTNVPYYFFPEYSLGDIVLIKWLQPLIIICNIYMFDFNKLVFTRAAGSFSTTVFIDHEKNYSKVRLSSGQDVYLYNYNYVSIGKNSNINSNLRVIGKAGVNRHQGFKSSVRGVAMNPVDHPNGGRTKTCSPTKNPWGRIAKNSK